jgi:hypothetical protein
VIVFIKCSPANLETKEPFSGWTIGHQFVRFANGRDLNSFAGIHHPVNGNQYSKELVVVSGLDKGSNDIGTTG